MVDFTAIGCCVGDVMMVIIVVSIHKWYIIYEYNLTDDDENDAGDDDSHYIYDDYIDKDFDGYDDNIHNKNAHDDININ